MADSSSMPPTSLPADVVASLAQDNPWWRGERLSGLPRLRRWQFGPLRKALDHGLTPAQVLRGPRQVGKSTLLNQIIEDLLDSGVSPRRILRVQFDELPEVRGFQSPILALERWFSANILRKGYHQADRDGERAYVFLDEVQNQPNWAPQLKHFVDMNPVRVLVTGSSALRIEAGRDSLAGRILTFEMGPLLLREICEFRGFGQMPVFLPANGFGALKERRTWQALAQHGQENAALRDLAFREFSRRGAYPAAQLRPDQPWEQVADLLNETVILRAIRHDLRMGPRGQKRDEHLLEEVFRLACRYAGQAPGQSFYLDELGRAMGESLRWQRVLAYLKYLDATLLVRLIEPLELRLRRRLGAAKLCLCDHALRAAWLQEVVPLAPDDLAAAPHLSDLAGRIAESTAGYFLRSIRGLDIAHFPERDTEPEVDFILTIGDQRIPVEVKYRRTIDYRDTHGVRSFLEKAHYNAPFGLVVTLTDDQTIDDPRIVSLPLSSLLLLR